MPRHSLLLVACALLFVGCGQTQSKAPELQSATAADHAASSEIEIREIRPGIWVHTSYYTYPGGLRFPSNGLIVREGDGLLLVDTAWGELRSVELLDRIEREIGLPVRRAIVTHAHYDRIAGVDALERNEVEVLAHPMVQKLTAAQGTPVPDDTLAGLAAPGAAVRIGSVEVFYPGAGHAPNNLMVWVPEQHVLFGGCAVRSSSSAFLGNLADADVASWPEAIRRAQARYPEAEVVVPGHGDVGGPELLRHTLRLLEE